MAIVAHGWHIGSSGSGAVTTVFLLAALGAASYALALRLVPGNRTLAVMTGVLSLGHPATTTALQSGQAMAAIASAVALLVAATIRLSPSNAVNHPGLGKREIAAMLFCAVAAALDVGSAFGAALIWLTDVSYDRGSFDVVATRWKRVIWGFAAVTFPAWWTVSGAAPSWAASGFSGAACVALCVPPSDGAIAALGILLPLGALATSAFIRQRHMRNSRFGISVGMGLSWVLLAILPGAIMESRTAPVLASFGMSWMIAVGLSSLGERVRSLMDAASPTLAPIPSVPGLRDFVRGAPSAQFPDPPMVKAPILMASAGVHAAVETAVAGAVAGVVSELRALVPKGSRVSPDTDVVLWDQLLKAPSRGRDIGWSSDQCAEIAARVAPGARVWIDCSGWPELIKSSVERGASVVVSLRGASQARAVALDWVGVESVRVVRDDSGVGAALAEGCCDVVICLLTCDGLGPTEIAQRIKSISRITTSSGRIAIAFTDVSSNEVRMAMKSGSAVAAIARETLVTCTDACGWRVTEMMPLSSGRSIAWLERTLG